MSKYPYWAVLYAGLLICINLIEIERFTPLCVTSFALLAVLNFIIVENIKRMQKSSEHVCILLLFVLD